ncbi:MAG: hypothetical protein K0U98_14635 [Deltaproteobacteria bacterium]|nr:hypothetical protein [Deltaproteobacteria bacterium]
MDLDPATGVISGTPSIATDDILYTVTASNDFGSTQTAVNIGVSPPADCPTVFTGLDAPRDDDPENVSPMWFSLSNGAVVTADPEIPPFIDENGDTDIADVLASWLDPATGQRTSTGLSTHTIAAVPGPFHTTPGIVLVGNSMAILASEVSWFNFGTGPGLDLNVDGDDEDRVLHLANTETGEVTKVVHATFPDGVAVRGQPVEFDGRLAFLVSEFEQGADLNGDLTSTILFCTL